MSIHKNPRKWYEGGIILNINDPHSQISFLWNPRINKMNLVTETKVTCQGTGN